MSAELSSTSPTCSEMDKFVALRALESPRAHDRLLAARFLERTASVEDVDLIQKALRKENVSWIRNSLAAAVERANGSFADEPNVEGDVSAESSRHLSDRQIEEIYGNALQETTSQLLHEIEPLLGIARLYAEREVTNFDQSKTKKQLDMLDSLLTAISKLRNATTPASATEIELFTLLREAKEQEGAGHEVEIQLAGPSPLIVLADRGRLWIAITNGLRNAIEATELLESNQRRPIVVNWNQTDHDYWVSIIDIGVGITASLDRIFEIGTSSKRNHVGMGLPTARQALSSMGGVVTVTPREEAGVRFEVRWPRYKTAQ